MFRLYTSLNNRHILSCTEHKRDSVGEAWVRILFLLKRWATLCFVEVVGWLAGSTDFSEPEVLELLMAERPQCLLKQHYVVCDPTFL